MDGKKEHIEFRLPAELRTASGKTVNVGSIRSIDMGLPLIQAAKIGAYVMRSIFRRQDIRWC